MKTLTTDEPTLAAGFLGSDQHSHLHADVNGQANVLAFAMYAHDSVFGLGDGTTADSVALGGIGFGNGFFDALPLSLTSPGLDRAYLGGTGVIPGGTWNCHPLGHAIVAPAAHPNGGDLIVYGQGAGATTLTLPDRGTIGGVAQGCMGSMQNLTNAWRGGASATGGPGDNNTFTLQFGAPWFASFPTSGNAPSATNPLCQVGAVILLQVTSLGVLRWFPVSCVANNVGGDYTKIQYNAFAVGSAIDACIPPLGQPVYLFDQAMLNPYNFKNPHNFFLRNLTLQGGSSTGTPLDGIGWRRSSGSYIGSDVSINGFWAGELICGTAMSGYIRPLTPPDPNNPNFGPQNTDHCDSSPNFAGNYVDRLYVTNSQIGGGGGSPARLTIGGGRDYWERGALFSTPGFAHQMVGDDGALQSADWAGMNMKSGACQVYWCGIAGVTPLEQHGLDGLMNFFKSESAGNWAFRDESKLRIAWAFMNVGMRFEAGLDIDGAGNNIDFTERPYHLTGVTMTNCSAGGSGAQSTTATGGTIGATLPQATIHLTSATGFATGGGIASIQTDAGLELILYSGISGNDLTGCVGGDGSVVSTAAVVAAIPTLVGTITETTHGIIVGTALQVGGGGPVTHLDASMNGTHFGSSLPSTIVTQDDLVALGMPSSGQVAIASSTGTQIVSYTNTGGTGNKNLTGCSGGKTNAVMSTGGAVTSQALNQETLVAFLDSDGQTIHCPVPQYTNSPDLPVGTTCTVGTIGFMRMGTLKRIPNWAADWDLQGVDRFVDGGLRFDLLTVGPMLILLSENDEGSVSKGTLPNFGVRDAQPVGGIYGSTWTSKTFTYAGHSVSFSNVFSSFETEFSQDDIGKKITASTVAGGQDTIAGFIDVNNVIMTGTVTNNHTGNLTWSMTDVATLDDPRALIQRGSQRWRLRFHSGSDAHPIAAGGQVEQITSTNGTHKVVRSQSSTLTSRMKNNVGVAMTASHANGRVSVTVNGSIGNAARIIRNAAAMWVMQPDSEITLGDSVTLLNYSGSAPAAGSLLVDAGDGTVAQVAGSPPTAGQLVVAQAIKAGTGGQIGASILRPYWTA